MTNSTQFQQAAAASAPSTMDNAAAAPLLEQEHSNAAPVFSFDDAPLFGVDGTTNDVHGDYFSSPEWTLDPSPALTTSMSFNMESCDTSPLLTDNYEAPDFSGMPLFGDYNSHALYSNDPTSAASPKRSPQNAFSRNKEVRDDESAMLLLRALSNHSNVGLKTKEETGTEQAPALTASPSVISSPLPASTTTTTATRPSLFPFSSFSSSSLSVQDKRTDRQQSSSFRGIKRRMESSELLPIDAPIQPRTYKTPSATSRKESTSFAAEEAEIAAEKDPLKQKRLSNTLAARRSRHRKAEERQNLLDQLEDEAGEKEMWKRRCIRAEEELERARAQGFI